jgi:Domain of unknown function (DUF4129)
VPSSVETRARILLAALALSVLALGATPSGQPQSAGIDRPTDAEVARALERVKKDPNLATDRTIRMLHWKRSQETTQKSRLPEWVLWLGELVRWVEQSARVLVWIVVIGLGGVLGVFLVRMVMARGAAGAFERFVPPTHVRDLDIRPESLPAEIGAAARALWDRGEHRAALALLYRGMLSRLAHVHRVPIRDSSTEGDCLSMVASHLAPRKREYTVLLVRVWQRFVYGGEDVEPSTVYALCHDFAPALDRAATLDVAAPQGSV